MEAPTPFNDPAKPILANDPALSDADRETTWDAFHQSKSPEELTQKMQTLAVPDDTKKQLFQAKQANMPAIDPVAKSKDVMTQLSQIDPKVLDAAEQHPNVLKLLSTAAGIGAKPAGEGAEATKTADKGNTQGNAKKLPTLVQPPRTDGLQHMPPIPDKHYRVMASDGGIHDIPAENIEQARETDPNLHVLNP